MVRSILAVVAGYLAMFLGISTFFAFALFLGLGGLPADPSAFQPPRWLLVLELVWSPIPAIAGGYVCAWVARRHLMRHAAALAVIMLVLGIVSARVESGLKPLWSTVAVILLGVLGVLGGARLRLARASGNPAAGPKPA